MKLADSEQAKAAPSVLHNVSQSYARWMIWIARLTPARRAELQRFFPFFLPLVATESRQHQNRLHSFTSTPFFPFSPSLTSFDFRTPTIKPSRSAGAVRFR
jgi:hypothetical protein